MMTITFTFSKYNIKWTWTFYKSFDYWWWKNVQQLFGWCIIGSVLMYPSVVDENDETLIVLVPVQVDELDTVECNDVDILSRSCCFSFACCTCACSSFLRNFTHWEWYVVLTTPVKVNGNKSTGMPIFKNKSNGTRFVMIPKKESKIFDEHNNKNKACFCPTTTNSKKN